MKTNEINFDYNFIQDFKIFNIEDFLNKLEKKYEKKYYISKNVSIIINNEEMIRTVISIYEKIKKIDFDDSCYNLYCTIGFINDKKFSIFDNEKELDIFCYFKIFEDNEYFGILDTLKNNTIKPDFIKTQKNKTEYISIDSFIIENNKINNKLYNLLGYIPNKIFNFSNEEYTVKNYENELIRLKLTNVKENLNILDIDFYNNIKIKLIYNDIFYYKDYIFCKTSSNNCIILNKGKKTN